MFNGSFTPEVYYVIYVITIFSRNHNHTRDFWNAQEWQYICNANIAIRGFCYWKFLFPCSKASDANTDIIAIFV